MLDDRIKPLSRREIGERIALEFDVRAVAAYAANNSKLAQQYERDAQAVREHYGVEKP